ncbi:MAG: (2Fe-2S) ferredoxin domain-containing protein [Clostridiales bacterium]|jgi:NADP-reducing hydrogenase subunit HndB|nr:(2Fe-2S) ferredoxin domain-containing protein [Clostridiales bacterium]
MKSLSELEEIRKRTLESVNLRKDRSGTRVVVGMGTCGIAAGARPVLLSFIEEIKKRNLQDVTVTQTGCIGVCRYEPMVEIYRPGEEKVTYVKMTPEKVKRVVAEHIVNGRSVTEFTIGAVEK